MESNKECSLPECRRKHVARGYCKLHYRRFMDHGDPLVGGPAPESIDFEGKRTCTRCKETKLIEEFGSDPRYRTSHKRICIKCMSKTTIAWHHANKERSLKNQRIARVRRIFGEDGLKIEERRRAGEGCDICGNRTVRMSIDHCHETEQVRGLLCKDCNLILGWVKDDPDRLRLMADYLDHFASSRVGIQPHVASPADFHPSRGFSAQEDLEVYEVRHHSHHD